MPRVIEDEIIGHVVYEDLTLKQFLRLPEAKPALEFIDGKVVQKLAAKRIHSVIHSMLGVVLMVYLRPRRLGIAYDELRCTYGGRSLVHDISFIARGRIPKDEKGRPVDDLLIPPDLAIEIISPGQTIRAMTARLTRSIAEGVRLAWLFQPRRERALVFRPDRPIEELGRGAILSGEDILPGFTIALDEVFDWTLED